MEINEKLKNSLNEKDVENVYRDHLLSEFKNANITSPHGGDGLLETDNVKLLMEFKYDNSLKNKLTQCNILIQCLYYLKKFEDKGEKLPSSIFIGDINECFAIHTNSIVKYLSWEIDWNIAPSNSYKNNTTLVQTMVNDKDITPFVFDIDEDFKFENVIENIKNLSDNVVRKIRITKHNIIPIYDYFNEHILNKVEMTTNQKANLFIQIVINPDENYLHPKRKNTLITKYYGELKINQNIFISFFNHFEGDVYSPKEKENLTGLVDRLVDDVIRRNRGEFFTPTSFVDLAHEYISETFGYDWKERFIVWDCAWGTGNLTRDYTFKSLYCSTLGQSDLDTTYQMGYNPNAVKFQYDFLNDGFDENCNLDIDKDLKLPQDLKEAINLGQEILFFINPPYATANNMGNKKGDHKGGVAQTRINKIMKNEGWGASTQSLYAQFLYRIKKINDKNKNIKIALFSPPLFLSGGSYKKFRNSFLSKFSFQRGFLFEASHFSNVSKDWGISFTLFDSGKNNYNDFIVDVIDYINEFELDFIKSKTIYNTDKLKPANKWIREEIKGMKTYDRPQLSTFNKIKQKGRGKSVLNHIGYFGNNANSLYDNPTYVFLLSECSSRGNGLSIIPENYFKTITLFTSRKVVMPTWVDCKDEYLVPNTEHPLWEQFCYDCIVYSLFNNSSQQSSLRGINYQNESWNIKNEFFWLSKEQMSRFADENYYDSIYKDTRGGENRFVYKKLFEENLYDNLTDDAKEILNLATEMVKKSMGMRKIMSDSNTDLHLDSWDAGYSQLKHVWKVYYPEEFEIFRKKYKELENRLKPLVYELGFLKK